MGTSGPIRRAPGSGGCRAADVCLFVPGGRIPASWSQHPLPAERISPTFFSEQVKSRRRQYRTFVGEWQLSPRRAGSGSRIGSGCRGAGLDRSGVSGGSRRYPVTDVSWREAAAYCAAHGKRLPTVSSGRRRRATVPAPGEGVMMPVGVTCGPATRPVYAPTLEQRSAPGRAYLWHQRWYGGVQCRQPPRSGSRIRCGTATASWRVVGKIHLSVCGSAGWRRTSSPALDFAAHSLVDTTVAGQDQGAFRIPIENAHRTMRPLRGGVPVVARALPI